MNLLKVANEVHLNGGITYNINTQETNPEHGYMVAIEGHEECHPYVDNEVLKGYVNKHSYFLAKDNYYLGIWWDGDKYVFDVSELFDNLELATVNAMARRQRALWDNANKNEIKIKTL